MSDLEIPHIARSCVQPNSDRSFSVIKQYFDSREKHMTTTLRTIPGFENYFVDATGRVFSTRTGELKELPTRTDEFGKKRVSLCQGKKARTLLVSTLIELSQQNLG